MAQDEVKVTDAPDSAHHVDEQRFLSLSIALPAELAFESDFWNILAKDMAGERRSLDLQLQ